MFNRRLSEFKGDNVVIGCSHELMHTNCDKTLHSGRDQFYTIDLISENRPDYVADITKPLFSEFKQRFKITLLEHLDYSAYNDFPSEVPKKFPNRTGHLGFENAWTMTKDDGFIVLVGCPRYKEFRNSIKHLKYIEIKRHQFNDDYEGNETVIISKNQALDIQATRLAIKSNPDLLNIITRTTSFQQIEDLEFCPVSYESMKTNLTWFRKILSIPAPKMTSTADQLFWNEIERRKLLIAADFDRTLTCLRLFQTNIILLSKLGLEANKMEQLIAKIDSAKLQILRDINRKNAKLVYDGSTLVSENTCALKLCDDAEKFSRQLQYTVTLATNETFLKNASDRSIQILKDEYDNLRSTAKGSFLAPKVANVLSSIALSLILPVVMLLFWSIVMPASLFATTLVPILLPLLTAGTILLAGAFYCCSQTKMNAAQFKTNQRKIRVDVADKLRQTFFPPHDKRDLHSPHPQLSSRKSPPGDCPGTILNWPKTFI